MVWPSSSCSRYEYAPCRAPTGDEYTWGQANFVQLVPSRAVAHILALPPLDHAAAEQLSYRIR